MASSFLQALRDFITLEQKTQSRQLYEIWSLPIEQRVAAGEAIGDIEVISVMPFQARLRFRQNLSKFRPNDNLRLSFDAPMSGFSTACVLESETDQELIVTPGFRSSFSGLSSGNGYTLDRDDVDASHILLNMLERVAEDPQQEIRFRNMLEGGQLPQFDHQRLKRGMQIASKAGFNPSQVQAFAHAYATENYYLVQGPPGTGKTRVLAQLATQLAAEGQRVLISAFTHRAINNALRTIGQKTGFPHVIKIGQPHNAEDLSWGAWQIRNYERFQNSPYTSETRGVIVGSTVYSLHTSRLAGVAFDTVIFDEAGQLTLPLALAGLLPADKVIFIGDHQQMPPVIVAEHNRDWLQRSVFETMFSHAPGTMLDTTYRMNGSINEFPSKSFYNGRLKVDASAEKRRLQLDLQSDKFARLLGPDPAELFVSIPHQGCGMRAVEEAKLAAGIAAEALFGGLPADEIAIVAPYRAQCRLIRQYLRTQADELNLPTLVEVVVDTVERIQGQERDVIIFSLVTSDPEHAAERAAFYFQPNRLNVAITRARVKRIVIGSPYLFETRVEDERLQRWVEVFRQLYESSSIIDWQDLDGA